MRGRERGEREGDGGRGGTSGDARGGEARPGRGAGAGGFSDPGREDPARRGGASAPGRGSAADRERVAAGRRLAKRHPSPVPGAPVPPGARAGPPAVAHHHLARHRGPLPPAGVRPEPMGSDPSASSPRRSRASGSSRSSRQPQARSATVAPASGAGPSRGGSTAASGSGTFVNRNRTRSAGRPGQIVRTGSPVAPAGGRPHRQVRRAGDRRVIPLSPLQAARRRQGDSGAPTCPAGPERADFGLPAPGVRGNGSGGRRPRGRIRWESRPDASRLWRKSLARRRGAKRRRGGSSLPAKAGGSDRASDTGRHPVGKAPRIRPDDRVPHLLEDGFPCGAFFPEAASPRRSRSRGTRPDACPSPRACFRRSSRHRRRPSRR